jgi:hypothetical protein
MRILRIWHEKESRARQEAIYHLNRLTGEISKPLNEKLDLIPTSTGLLRARKHNEGICLARASGALQKCKRISFLRGNCKPTQEILVFRALLTEESVREEWKHFSGLIHTVEVAHPPKRKEARRFLGSPRVDKPVG